MSLGAVVAAVAALAVAAWLLPTMPAVHAGGGGGGGGFTPPPWPQVDPCQLAGSASRWEASRPVGPYSEVNLRTGRVLTTLPIVGWSGKGPAVGFALYHNMTTPWGPPDGYIIEREEIEPEPLPEPYPGLQAGDANGDGTVTPGDVDPFIDIMLAETPTQEEVERCDFDGDQEVGEGDLGQLVQMLMTSGEPMWTHSYSRHLEFEGCGLTTNQVALVWDDAARDVFNWVEATQDYSAPAGVFLELEKVFEGEPSELVGYEVTAKSQDKMRFDVTGRLEWLQDASGNQVSCTYVSDPESPAYGKLDYVTDASGRVLYLAYNAAGKLKWINDPINRLWTLLYADPADPNAPPSGEYAGAFVALADPMWYQIKWEYGPTDWNIVKMYDKEGSEVRTEPPEDAHPEYWHEFAYDKGRLRTVTDPDPDGAGSGAGLTQEFWYYKTTMGNWQSKYVDRRGSQWWVHFAGGTCNLDWWKDPLDHVQRLAHEDSRPRLAHEPTCYKNALGKEWTTSYDWRGNVLSVTDPLQHRTTMEYDALNNLTSVTPPGEVPLSGNTLKQVLYNYTDALHPTSVTEIVQPADGYANPAATIAMAYYDADDAQPPFVPEAWDGRLKSVTDGNGVETLFEYDSLGQPFRILEGPISSAGTWRKVLEARHEVNAVGWEAVTNRREIEDAQSGGGRHSVRFPGCQDRNANGSVKTVCCCQTLCCNSGRFCGAYCAMGNEIGCFSTLDGGGAENCGSGDETPRSPRNWRFSCYPFPYNATQYGSVEYSYDRLERMTGASSGYADDTLVPESVSPPEFNISATQHYDRLGRVTHTTRSTTEHCWIPDAVLCSPASPMATREFSYTYDDQTGIYTRTGPDSHVTQTVTDTAGRVTSITRTGAAGSLSASYAYDAADRVTTVTYGNGTVTRYEYDDAGRVTLIRHEKADQSTLLQLGYTYTPDGLIATVTEIDDGLRMTLTTYGYDNRNRLVSEQRAGLGVPFGLYHLEYTYDQGGNRLSKTDYAASVRAEYHYDVDWTPTDINGDSQMEDPRSYYGTRNNRLMYYELFDSVTPGTGNVTERVEYYYGHDAPPAEASNGTEAGSPTLIVRKLIDPVTHLPTAYHGTSLAYNHQGEVAMMIERTWSESATGGPDCETETLGRGIEFLGNGRTRYGVRQREFVADPYDYWYWSIVEGTTLWSDYDGEEVYGDYTVTATKTWDEQEQVWVYGPPELHNVAAYLPGVGWMRTDPATSETTVYYGHADHLGTLRATSDGAGQVLSRLVLTAFGETVAADGTVGTRYQYAGEWGYESALGSPGNGGATGQPALPWQHVGHRWYDPSTGRFIQRDPIGIQGGLNVYEYVRGLPTMVSDSSGLMSPPTIPWPKGIPPAPGVTVCACCHWDTDWLDLASLGHFLIPLYLVCCHG